jgi:hypothetical protein
MNTSLNLNDKLYFINIIEDQVNTILLKISI